MIANVKKKKKLPKKKCRYYTFLQNVLYKRKFGTYAFLFRLFTQSAEKKFFISRAFNLLVLFGCTNLFFGGDGREGGEQSRGIFPWFLVSRNEICLFIRGKARGKMLDLYVEEKKKKKKRLFSLKFFNYAVGPSLFRNGAKYFFLLCTQSYK